jgi:hypothetical protein
VTGWRGDRAEVRSLLTGSTSELPADTLVLAETPRARTELADALLGSGSGQGPEAWPGGPAVHLVGDCVAGRRASLAIYEARELAQRL